MYKPELYKTHTSITNHQELKDRVKADKLFYPKIHLAPEYGLLNDPNGLAFYNGEFQIFYQYHPNQPAHGMKNWFHVTTKDFITYTHRGIILFPEQDYENYGIFSGNAKLEGEYLRLNYTANYRNPDKDYQREPKQCYALMDKNYQIVKKGIISEFLDQKYTEHFRDPYVTADDATVIGAQLLNGIGALSIIENNHERTIEMSNELSSAYMLECPNYIEIDNHPLLILSPQGINNDKYLNINSVVWMETMLRDKIDANPHLLDYGFDLYAPQVFKHDERVLMLSWLGHADTIYPNEQEYGWSQTMSLMRELTFKDGHLYQQPIAEYQALRQEVKKLACTEAISRVYEVDCKISNNGVIKIGDVDHYIEIKLDNRILTLDRSRMNYSVNANYGYVRSINLEVATTSLQIFVDNSTLEIYINDGEYVMSSRIFLNNLGIVQLTNTEGKYYELDPITIINQEVDNV
ncbi:GH32 C-terminal domain-containing protein [Mollicutes bacterium LVI A0039]|nr:GH32 C-terminal domain-containing protein [Mollicutes bacterium LVI A0039]